MFAFFCGDAPDPKSDLDNHGLGFRGNIAIQVLSRIFERFYIFRWAKDTYRYFTTSWRVPAYAITPKHGPQFPTPLLSWACNTILWISSTPRSPFPALFTPSNRLVLHSLYWSPVLPTTADKTLLPSHIPPSEDLFAPAIPHKRAYRPP
jgi:hypothetical protein